MKKALLTPVLAALAAAIAFVAAPTPADAGGHGSSRRISSCGSCGHGIYATYQYFGRQSCGTPIYRWVTQSHRCSHSGHGHSSRGHSSHGGHRGPHSSPRVPVPPIAVPRPPSHGYSRGPSFSFSFGRGGSSCR